MHKNNNAGDVIKCQTTENMFYMKIHLKIAESVTTTCSVIVYGMIEVNSVYHSTIFCIIRFRCTQKNTHCIQSYGLQQHLHD